MPLAGSLNQARRLARKIEQDLDSKLAEQRAPHAHIISLLQEYRGACEKTIFADFQYAAEHNIEAQLWAVHGKVNTHFRKQLSMLNRDGKKRAVEMRVLTKQYLEFIKASQRFYRQYFVQLDAVSGGIPELRDIAMKWTSDVPNGPPAKDLSPDLKHRIKMSLYQTIIQLGDLSRYRELQWGDKERNWTHAIGYYGLATSIYPDSGISHNQQAVIALADGNHFRATYHLYRSLAAKEPHPLAKSNLELEFKKVIAAWARREPISKQANREGSGANQGMIAWFVRLHSKCYRGKEFTEHDELENEFLSQMAVGLKERSLEGLLQKFILINIAAEYFASVQLQGKHQAGNTAPEDIQSYFYFLRLNVKTFFVLLQTLQPELERLTGEDVNATEGERPQQLSDKVTAVARRILPGLRLYSTWFTNTWTVLSADIEGSVSKVDVQELWKAYAEILNLLVSAFEARHLPMEQYMLEEDVDTLGFQPLFSEKTSKVWYTGDELKPKWSDEGLERNHPNVEMLMRIRDFLVDGLQLTQDESAPLALDGTRFFYQEAGIPSQVLISPGMEAETAVPVDMLDVEVPRVEPSGPVADDQASHDVAPSETASIAKDAAMNRMVDDLLGPEDGLDPLPEEDEDIPPTPPEQTFEDTALINDSSYGITPLNAGDYVNMDRNYSQASCTPEGQHRTSTASPAMRNLPSLPSLPGDFGIWSKNYESPLQNTPVVPPGLNAGALSFGRQSMGHSRHASLNTPTWSPMPMPQGRSGSTPDSSYDATLASSYQPHGNGNGNALYGQGLGLNDNAYDINMRSPLLFGGGAWGTDSGNWGTDMSRSRSSFMNSPSNGQGG